MEPLPQSPAQLQALRTKVLAKCVDFQKWAVEDTVCYFQVDWRDDATKDVVGFTMHVPGQTMHPRMNIPLDEWEAMEVYIEFICNKGSRGLDMASRNLLTQVLEYNARHHPQSTMRRLPSFYLTASALTCVYLLRDLLTPEEKMFICHTLTMFDPGWRLDVTGEVPTAARQILLSALPPEGQAAVLLVVSNTPPPPPLAPPRTTRTNPRRRTKDTAPIRPVS